MLLKARNPSFARKMMDPELTALTSEQDLGMMIVLWKCHFRAVNVHFMPHKKKNLKNHMKDREQKQRTKEKTVLFN